MKTGLCNLLSFWCTKMCLWLNVLTKVFLLPSAEEDAASASAGLTPKVQAQPILSNGVAAEDSSSLRYCQNHIA